MPPFVVRRGRVGGCVFEGSFGIEGAAALEEDLPQVHEDHGPVDWPRSPLQPTCDVSKQPNGRGVASAGHEPHRARRPFELAGNLAIDGRGRQHCASASVPRTGLTEHRGHP
jgi:hypothetical protein